MRGWFGFSMMRPRGSRRTLAMGVVLTTVVAGLVTSSAGVAVATSLGPEVISVSDSAGGTASIGSTVHFVFNLVAFDHVTPPGPGVLTMKTSAGVTLCSLNVLGLQTPEGGDGIGFGALNCDVTGVGVYPVLTTPPAGYPGASPVRYGTNDLTITFTPNTSNGSGNTLHHQLLVVSPPASAYTLPMPALTMSAQGPCSPFNYIQGNEPTAPSVRDMWGQTAGEHQPVGAVANTPWAMPGNGCNAVTQVSGKAGTMLAGSFTGCTVDLVQSGCLDNPLNWGTQNQFTGHAEIAGCRNVADLTPRNRTVSALQMVSPPFSSLTFVTALPGSFHQDDLGAVMTNVAFTTNPARITSVSADGSFVTLDRAEPPGPPTVTLTWQITAVTVTAHTTGAVLAGSAGTFTQDEVGSLITGPGISSTPARIKSVSVTGATATLDHNELGSVAPVTLTLNWNIAKDSGGQCVAVSAAHELSDKSLPSTAFSSISVPSSTVNLPIKCDFQYSLANNAARLTNTAAGVYGNAADASPWDGTHQNGYTVSPAADPLNSASYQSGNNGGEVASNQVNSPVFGEGDGMRCTASAEWKDPADGTWKPLVGASTTVDENQAVSKAQLLQGLTNDYSKTGNLTVTLPNPTTTIRVKYQYWIFQDGSLDGTNRSDFVPADASFQNFPDGRSTTDPIGSRYCWWAAFKHAGSAAATICANNKSGATGTTPPLTLDVRPDHLVQVEAIPSSIVYAPPGPYDSATVTNSSSTSHQVEMSVGTSQGSSNAVTSSLGFDVGASIGIDEIFKIDAKFGMSWSSSTTDSKTDTTTDSNSVLLTTSQSASYTNKPGSLLATAAVPAPTPVQLGASVDRHSPWLYDKVFLTQTPKIALYNMNTCKSGAAPTMSGQYWNPATQQIEQVPSCPGGAVTLRARYFPFATGGTTVTPVSIVRLVGCVNATAANVSTVCLMGSGFQISPATAKAIIMQDPFAATGLGYASVPNAGVGGATDPSLYLHATAGQNSFGSGSTSRWQFTNIGDSVTPAISSEQDKNHTWTGTSTVATKISSTVENHWSVSVELNIPIDIVELGLSAGISGSGSVTTGSTLGVTLENTTSETLSNAWGESALMDNGDTKAYPHDVQIYQDPRFGTMMFRSRRPTIGSVVWRKAANSTVQFRVQEPVTSQTTTLDSGSLDVFFCPNTTVTGCVVAQNQTTMHDAKLSLSDRATVNTFPATKFVAGKSYYVYVESPGGISTAFLFKYPATCKKESSTSTWCLHG